MYCKNETDETLVMLTLAGEQSAYEALVSRYQRAVIASALSVTKTAFMAEDAAQDAFVTAWMKLDTLAEPSKYCQWVCRIAKNCAINMISRYRSFLPLETVDNLYITEDASSDPAEAYALSEERNQVNKSIEMLPEKVRQIIYLHYFENLSVAEIADRMRVSSGTVKWQLHDGRKRIRKELCAMNEKYSDTLIQRVMKKVEELKLWQVKNNKSGFEKVYKDVLSRVEELPECKEKQHALADVLMRGWWWLPGEKNDALFARIAEAAIEGKNEEVMTFIITREDSKVYGEARIEFMRDKQIPRLEKAGFVKALGREWFWLGHNLFRQGKAEEGNAAYDKAQDILPKDDTWHILVPDAKKVERRMNEHYKDLPLESFRIGANMAEFRIIDGKLRFFKDNGIGIGFLGSIDNYCHRLFRNASHCDGHFFTDLSVGESFIGTDGTTLTFVSENEIAETPAGRFEGCRLWETRFWRDSEKSVCRTYYKDGIGIVRQDLTTDCITTTHLLKAYDIKGGSGLMPLYPENTWEYVSDHSPEAFVSELKFTVSFVNDGRIGIKYYRETERLGYNEASWLDAVQEIANEYCKTKNGIHYICDVNSAAERAERLALTPMEKTHARVAASVVRRIMATDTTFNPDHTATGHWNFFNRVYIRKKSDSLILTGYNPRWSFEWKSSTGISAEEPILQNDILGILQDAANCLWSDEWRIGTSPIVEYTKWDRSVKTQITCEDGGTITTKAGTFENCFKLCLDIGGMEGGWSYRGGKKVYYFADGIGIVRIESVYGGGSRTSVYELTSYTGTGEGFMPIADGLVRRYDALDLTDGFVGAVEYTYVADDDGDIVVFADRTGIRELPPPITEYGSIQGELIEQQLCDAGKWKEGQIKYGANSFHLFLHLMARPGHNIYDAKRSIEINGFYMKLMELLGENGEVPPAWYGLYAWSAIVRAAALFGDGRIDEGYSSLDICVSYCDRIKKLKPGDNLEVGNAEIFKGIKYEYTKSLIILPDGSKESAAFHYRMEFDFKNLVHILTAPFGWEWFDSVRNEDRFKEYIERARKMAEKE